MQFNVVALFAVLASVAAAQSTVTVTVCESTIAPAATGVKPTGAYPTAIGSTGVVTSPKPTGSPIFTGAASVNGASALGMIIAGGVALLL